MDKPARRSSHHQIGFGFAEHSDSAFIKLNISANTETAILSKNLVQDQISQKKHV